MTTRLDTEKAAGEALATGDLSHFEGLRQRIEARTANVGIIGLGYVGLPLARAFAGAGFSVHGFDVDQNKIDQLNRGESYLKQIPGDWILERKKAGKFNATSDFRSLRQMHAIIICVPTPISRNREPDLSYIEKTAHEIRQYLDRGQLIVLESTTFPGTTEEVVQPILEESGLEAGQDFFLAFSPEREDPGNRKFGTQNIPKLVGGIDPSSGELAAELYRGSIDEVIQVSHAKIAEAAKILENIYRAVNIALVNELKVLFDRMDINVWEVIQAASTKPFGFQPFYPGPGLGGHCIPIDPFYLTWKAREYNFSTRFIELAGEINTQMPEYVVTQLMSAMDSRAKMLNGSSGLILGVAYKPDVDDVRESPAFEIIERLLGRNVNIEYHDPHVAKIPPMRRFALDMESVPLTQEVLESKDFVVIVTNHSGIDWDFLVEHSRLVIDTRNATAGVTQGREKIVRA
jgi:UDP-N-acetyl-D-glucosamine dehydrogenase